eukprot:UN22781
MYCLKSKLADIERQSGGVAQKNINLSILKGLKIPLPPLAVQKQIAAVLEKADTLRGQCQQMEQELNTLAQSVFLELFGDPVKTLKVGSLKQFHKLYESHYKTVLIMKKISMLKVVLRWLIWEIHLTV